MANDVADGVADDVGDGVADDVADGVADDVADGVALPSESPSLSRLNVALPGRSGQFALCSGHVAARTVVGGEDIGRAGLESIAPPPRHDDRKQTKGRHAAHRGRPTTTPAPAGWPAATLDQGF